LVYGAEAMGDPWEVFSRSGIRHPLRIYFRLSLTARMKKQISGAASVAYVTEKTLQKRYPSGSGALSTGVSNIDLLPTHLARTAKTRNASEVLRITSVGSLEQLYKNPDIVLHAVARCVQDGMKIQLTWIGGGAFLPEMIKLAKSLGIERSVRFLGQLPSGDAIREELDQSDLFVLASKTEGLPRALIEAMARGLPCIGSDVGGIPELLEPRELFLPNLPEALFAKIKEVAANPELMKEMGERNLRKSREFLKEKLDRKRAVFLRELRLRTESALK
ncbi:MAG: glycosyltransferase family 4 protein, partial [Cryobacterium sp.]|nr:glycosyltransferase family 4 protein [Oligoflexia bacterium]